MGKIYLFIFFLLITPLGAMGQVSPPLPVPVTESEIRDDSLKMRSNELERIKRDSRKPLSKASAKEREIRFAKIKNDFEGIQKSQDQIIKAYTTGKKINFKKISRAAANLRKQALRLDKNLFGSEEEDKPSEKNRSKNPNTIRNLIIELDRAIGNFVKSPIFNNKNVVELEESRKARRQLQKIIELSHALSKLADKSK